MDNVFKQVFLNTENEQPHLFKEKKIKEMDIQIFVDDDELLADYLATKFIDKKIFCLSNSDKLCGKATKIYSLASLLE